MTSRKKAIINLLTREWLLFGSLAGLIISSLFLKGVPRITKADIDILFLLFSLFVTVKGLENSGFIKNVALRLEGKSLVALKLTLVTFFASMIFTNDAALVVVVPITLGLKFKNTEALVILESLAANAGSAMTPFGNPQNLYIYWYYNIQPLTFFAAIAPFSIVFLIILILCALYLSDRQHHSKTDSEGIFFGKRGLFYMAANLVVILTILKVLPLAAAMVLVLFILVFDPKCFKIDYGLLLTMLCFLGISENMKAIFQSIIEHSDHIFLLSSLSSQVISNVPAALLFAKFTSNWKALLWGTNVGGFGGLIGSLANLIAYKIYISSQEDVNVTAFTRKFVVANYVFFTVGIMLFYLFKPYLY